MANGFEFCGESAAVQSKSALVARGEKGEKEPRDAWHGQISRYGEIERIGYIAIYLRDGKGGAKSSNIRS
jgi:hypothetical protein